VQIQSLTPDMAASLGVKSAKGAIVASVVDDSPASKAGFHQGDVVVSLNGSGVDDNKDLTRKVASLRVGDKAQFGVLREGQNYTLVATIAKRDEAQLASADRPETPDRADRGAHVAATTALGLGLSALTDQMREQYNIDDKTRGVVISSVDPNSEAADKGFRPGDVIVGIGNRNVRAPMDVEEGIAEAKKAGRETVLLLVAGDQGQHYVALKVAKG
jgi:serine protease Do